MVDIKKMLDIKENFIFVSRINDKIIVENIFFLRMPVEITRLEAHSVGR